MSWANRKFQVTFADIKDAFKKKTFTNFRHLVRQELVTRDVLKSTARILWTPMEGGEKPGSNLDHFRHASVTLF